MCDRVRIAVRVLFEYGKFCARLSGLSTREVGAGFMTNEQSEIPLAMDDELSHGARRLLPMDAEPVSRTSLESERFGLLAAPESLVDKDRRMEEWIASNLDLGDDAPPRAA